MNAKIMTQKTTKSILAFITDKESTAVVKQACEDLSAYVSQVANGNVQDAAARLSSEPSPSLLIVDLGTVSDPVARIRELADACEPNVEVVVIGEKNDVVLYRDLKSAGVSEYFVKPLVRNLLMRTCLSLLEPEIQINKRRRGKLIQMLGARGGVGCTTLATSSAWHFAEVRKRSTILVDLNLQTGDAALQLNVAHTQALLEAFSYPDRVDRLFLERGTVSVTERLELLSCLEPLGTPIPFNADGARALLDKLLNKFHFVIVDLPHGATAEAASLLPLPSARVIISDASLTSARDVARWRDVIGANSPDHSTLHVLNERSRVGLTTAEFTEAAGLAPDFVIAHDRHLSRASIMGINAIQKSPVFNRSLLPFLQHFTGQASTKRVSSLQRMLG